MPELKQLAHGLDVPLTADTVDAPIVQCGGGMTAIHFTTSDGRWGRVTFERLDSIKVSRGEHELFPPVPTDMGTFHWVTTISNSLWLQERYEYEKRYYGSAYNFGGNVEEMLTEFSHYVFSFHDQFVEVLAAGIWFESDDTMLGNRDPNPDHPLRGLRHIEPSERFEESGITCQVRRNPLSNDELRSRALLCSQTILEIAAELDGRAGTDWSLTLRIRNGIGKTHLRNYFGNQVTTFDGIPDLSVIRPPIDKWLRDVRKRRREMGKT
ncbi:MAG: hypothetical protein WA117_26615 [Verrucomicrobiia bacterium]